MDAQGHAFIATRAVALLEQDPDTRSLAGLLTPNLPHVARGAWLPDERFLKSGHGNTQNHVLKMVEYHGPNKERFIVSREETIQRLGEVRKLREVLAPPGRLPDAFWDKPYVGDCPRGDHPANCAMGLATTLIDLLCMGDHEIRRHLPEQETWIDLPAGAQTRELQAALYFFMLSHYVADAHMPCHADARRLASYKGDLHKKWEKYITKQVARFPADPEEIAGLAPDALLARAVGALELDLPKRIPNLRRGVDIWAEVVQICRAAFAVNCIVAPPGKYPLVKTDQRGKDAHEPAEDAPTPSFAELFEDRAALLDALTYAILHDSVLGVAMVWKHIWQKLRR